MFLEGPVLDDGNKAKKWEDLTWDEKNDLMKTKLSFNQIIRKKIDTPKVIFRNERQYHNSLAEIKRHLQSKIKEETPDEPDDEEDSEMENPDTEYVIEDMVGFVKAGGQLRIICKWKDYDDSENTNESFENLANSMFMVKKFVREQLKKDAYLVRVVESENYRWEEEFSEKKLQFVEPLQILCYDASNDWVVVQWKNTPDLTYHTRQEAEEKFFPLWIKFLKRNINTFNRGIIRDPKLPQTMGDPEFYEKHRNKRN